MEKKGRERESEKEEFIVANGVGCDKNSTGYRYNRSINNFI